MYNNWVRKIRLFIVIVTMSFTQAVVAQDVMMQGWYWDYPKTCNGAATNWTQELNGQSTTLADAGFTYLWLPPLSRASFGACSNGYDPKDLYDLGEYGQGPTGFGTKAEVDALISTLDAKGIKAVADVVYNHRDGGAAETNPALKTYMDNFTVSKNAFPSDRYRCVIPLGGLSGNGAGDYYFKVSSKTQDSKYHNKTYKMYFETNQVGWQNLADTVEVEPNGGGDCGESNNPVILGRNFTATIDDTGCTIDEYHLTLTASDFDAAGDYLYIYLSNVNGDYSDHRIFGIWNGAAGADIVNQLDYQTYTDFTNLPSGQGGMNYENFKPNTTNASSTYLAGDWDWLWFFYDYDQSQADTKAKLFDWTEWLLDDVNIQGLRMDAVKHFPPSFIGELMNDLQANNAIPELVVGEFYDGNASLLKGWVDDVTTNMNAAAQSAIKVKVFDFALRQSLKDASDAFGYDVRNVFNSGVVDGAAGSGFNTVTFINNHDFRDAGQPVENDPMLGYAYILTNNRVGLPSVFYPDYFGVSLPHGPTVNLQADIDELINIQKNYIFNSSVDYLSRISTPYASNYIASQATTTLLYQLSGGIGGKEVIVCINYSGDTLKVDHAINSTTGTQFGDYLGHSSYPIANVSGSNQIYIELPPRSYSVWIEDFIPLPLTLIDFKAQGMSHQNVLTWTTAQEENVDGFEVHRSFDGISFDKIGFVPAENTKNSNYSFNDTRNQHFVSEVYYRLKMNDLDGTFTWSDIESVKTDYQNSWQIRQNPISSELTVDFQLAQNSNVTIQVFSLMGEQVVNSKHSIVGKESVVLDISHLPKGSFILQVKMGSEYQQKLLIKN